MTHRAQGNEKHGVAGAAALAVVLAVLTAAALAAGGAHAALAGTVHAPGLQAAAQVVRDGDGVPHIYTANDHDAAFMLGWMHAQDRLFQMDALRREFSGTLAELVGQGGLASDVQLRTLGLRRAAEESLPTYPVATVAWLQAYADGVNAYVQANPLPSEYAALMLSKASLPAWTPIDSLTVAKGLAFGLSFDLSDIDRTVALAAYEAAGTAAGFDPVALFFEDINREAPFDPTISIPGWLHNGTGPGAAAVAGAAGAEPSAAGGHAVTAAGSSGPAPAPYLSPAAVALAARYRAKAAQVPLLAAALAHTRSFTGSNWWVVGGALSASGKPLLANDPHLSLSTPPVFYEVHMLSFQGGHGRDLDVSGVSFPGTPAVVLGCNARICWGATTNPMDVTDVYLEQLVINPQTGLPTATLFEGKPEALVAIPQTFRFNQLLAGHQDDLAVVPVGPLDGGVTLVVPRRNNGPIISVDTAAGANVSALSVQYTGWRATREIDSLLTWQRAANLDDFKRGLQWFHFGSQNWSYADVNGNIAYFTSGAQPLREDLQTLGAPDGAPPTFIRDGTHHFKNEWLPVTSPQPGQQLAYEILPSAEMPQTVNPAQGYVLTANNDPIGITLDNNLFNEKRAGGGVYYFGAGYSSLRAGQIHRLLTAAIAAKGKLAPADLMTIQQNNQLLDAAFFVPYITAAFANAGSASAPQPLAALAADPGVAEAVGRLQAWDFSTPTGVLNGYDPDRDPASFPTAAQVASSVAATIYTIWRGQFVEGVLDATLAKVGLGSQTPDDDHALRALKQLLVEFPATQGFGASGLNFFEGTGPGLANPADARDLLILQSLRQALDQLAGDAYADAFGHSPTQKSYRWGKLHRIVFASVLGGPFDIPGGGDFSDYAPNLPGLAKGGGYETIDAASFGLRGAKPNDFMFGSGPARRFVGDLLPGGIDAHEVIPGGESGALGSPDRANQLERWLTDQYHPLLITSQQVLASGGAVTHFVPAD